MPKDPQWLYFIVYGGQYNFFQDFTRFITKKDKTKTIIFLETLSFAEKYAKINDFLLDPLFLMLKKWKPFYFWSNFFR